MATTNMLTGNALTVKLWALKGFTDTLKNTAFGRMVQRGTIMRVSELDNSRAGDEVTVSFTGLLSGIGITEGGTLTGNEEALDNQSFKMAFNVARHAVANPNDDTIEQARTLINFEERARSGLQKWHQSRVDASVFNQLAGVNSTNITVDGTVYSGTNRTIVQGLNTIAVPSSNRIIRAGGRANDQSLTSADTFTLDLVDAAIELAASTYPTIEKLDNEEFDLYLSPQQITDLRRDSSGKVQWLTIAASLAQGGNADILTNSNGYSSGLVGRYGSVLIYSRDRVAGGVSSADSSSVANVRRAVLCGRNALGFASRFSGALKDAKETNGNVPMVFKQELKDFGYIKAIEARMIYGVKKLQFAFGGTAQDFGSIVISTFAAAHTS
jgi:hypothetical protein